MYLLNFTRVLLFSSFTTWSSRVSMVSLAVCFSLWASKTTSSYRCVLRTSSSNSRSDSAHNLSSCLKASCFSSLLLKVSWMALSFCLRDLVRILVFAHHSGILIEFIMLNSRCWRHHHILKMHKWPDICKDRVKRQHHLTENVMPPSLSCRLFFFTSVFSCNCPRRQPIYCTICLLVQTLPTCTHVM